MLAASKGENVPENVINTEKSPFAGVRVGLYDTSRNHNICFPTVSVTVCFATKDSLSSSAI